MKDLTKREMAFERVIFFSDAILAIAITFSAGIDKDKPADSNP